MMVADPESRTRYLSRYERGMIYKYPFHSPANSKEQILKSVYKYREIYLNVKWSLIFLYQDIFHRKRLLMKDIQRFPERS